MRHSSIILFAAAVAICAASCNKEPKNPEITLSAPSISTLEQTVFTIPETVPDEILFRLMWSAAQYLEDGVVNKNVRFEYSVEYSSATDDFNHPVTLLSTGSASYADVSWRMIAGIYESIAASEKLAEDEPAVAALRIRASCGDSVTCSEKLMVTINPYVAPSVLTSIDRSAFTAPASMEVRLAYPGTTDTPALSLSWSRPVFHYGKTTKDLKPVQYALEIDSRNNGFARGRTISSTEDTGMTLYNTQLNNIIVGEFGGKALNAYDVEFRLKVNYGEGADAGVFYSDTLSLTIIPYATLNAMEPLFVIGDLNAWKTASPMDMVPMFKNSNSADDKVFIYTGYMPAGNFKFLPYSALGSYLCLCNDDDNPGRLVWKEQDGGAIPNETAGYKRITVDLGQMTWEISDFDASSYNVWSSIGFIGTFTSWNSDLAMTKAGSDNPHIWSLEFNCGEGSDGYHCGKFRANGSWDHLWNNILGMEWEIPFGTMTTATTPDVNIYFDMHSADYYVAFNDITAQFIVFKK